MEYAERLHVPLRWWVQGTMLVASLWLALIVGLPDPAAWAATAFGLVLMGAGFIWIGSARLVVDGERLRAGRASIPLEYVGRVEPLGPQDTRRVTGVDADARAYLLLRPYLKRSVRVEITDPADPTPYWLLHTRHPDRLAAALAARTDRDAASPPPVG